jgi:anti-sigma B factor antagonist
MRLGLETEQIEPGVCVISPAGELDLYTCPEFKEELLRVISNGARHVVVDLTATTFVDSTALGVLLRGVERLRAQDGRLAVVCPDSTILRVFEVTGLHRILEIHGSRADALAGVDAE